ncbi:MAG: VWA domain-containing protein, partial [Candidatus Bipolaricaulia bacterium]
MAGLITCARSLGRGVAVGAIIALLIWGLGGLGAQQSSLIAVEQGVSPGEIYYQSSGEPDRATVTLTLNALRDAPFPLDLVLVVDRSASSDVITVRQIGREILGRLGGEDRAALVSFADEATLDVGLTHNRGAVVEALDRLENEGKTALGEGLAEANRELLENGREDAVWVEILLVDGRSNAGRDPLPQAEIAGRNGIVIFAIGIGRYLREDILNEITGDTGGAFFEKYEEGVLDELFSKIDRDLVGTRITITETLAAGFSYAGAPANSPAVSSRDGLTTLTWNVEELPVGGSWSTSYEISYAPPLSERETLEIFTEPGTLSFTDFRHQARELELAMLSL